MSSPRLWLTIEPLTECTQLMLTEAGVGTSLTARLPASPAQPGAPVSLMEALSAWYGSPLYGVLDADARDVQREPARWARLLGDAAFNPNLVVEWSSRTVRAPRKDLFFGDMREFAAAKRLLSKASTGQP